MSTNDVVKSLLSSSIAQYRPSMDPPQTLDNLHHRPVALHTPHRHLGVHPSNQGVNLSKQMTISYNKPVDPVISKPPYRTVIFESVRFPSGKGRGTSSEILERVPEQRGGNWGPRRGRRSGGDALMSAVKKQWVQVRGVDKPSDSIDPVDDDDGGRLLIGAEATLFCGISTRLKD